MRGGQFDLTGTVSIVTGGSRGIGRALAVGLAMAGSDVVVASRKLANCQQVADQIEHQTGRRALAVAYHAGQWEESDRLVETVYAEFGRCDVLVNNAGTAPAYEDLCSVSEALWTKVHQVNAMGPFRLVQQIECRHEAVRDQFPIERQCQFGAVSPGRCGGDIVKPVGVGLQREGQAKRRCFPVEQLVAQIEGSTLPIHLLAILETGHAADIVGSKGSSHLDPEIPDRHEFQFEFLAHRPVAACRLGKPSRGLALEFVLTDAANIRADRKAKQMLGIDILGIGAGWYERRKTQDRSAKRCSAKRHPQSKSQ